MVKVGLINYKVLHILFDCQWGSLVKECFKYNLNLYSFSKADVTVTIFNQFVGLATKQFRILNNIQVTFTSVFLALQ